MLLCAVGHTTAAALARRPAAVEPLLLAACRGDARLRSSCPLGGPPRSRRLVTRPPLDAAAYITPVLNTARLWRRASLRSHTTVTALARRPAAIESFLIATRRSDASARSSRPLKQPPRSRRVGTQPSLDAAACASCPERGASLAPCFSARSHDSGCDGSSAGRRRVASARHLTRRRSRAPFAPARSAAVLAVARHSAAARSGGLRLLR